MGWYPHTNCHIFAEQPLSSLLALNTQKLKQVIDEESGDRFLSVDEDQQVTEFVDTFSIPEVKLQFDEVYVTDYEAQIPAELHPSAAFLVRSGESYRRQVLVYHLPFTGNKHLLKLTPTTRLVRTQEVMIEDAEITFELVDFRNDANDMNRTADHILDNITKQLDHVLTDVRKYNADLSSQVREFLKGRKECIEVRSRALNGLKFPVRQSANKTRPPQSATSEPSPVPLTTPSVLTPPFADDKAPLRPTFTWSAVARATGYEFVLAEETGQEDKFASIDYSATITINGHVARETLKYSTIYNWRVRAVTGAEKGPWIFGFFTTIPYTELTLPTQDIRSADEPSRRNHWDSQSAFISYGGPDELFAESLNRALQDRGIKTFFFAQHAIPGQKLHRLMREGVNTHDRVVLVCSRDSLDRPGVVNELEETLQREAREGGRSILIPIALDDYVFTDWAPERHDIAQAIRDRVVADFRGAAESQELFDATIERLIQGIKTPG